MTGPLEKRPTAVPAATPAAAPAQTPAATPAKTPAATPAQTPAATPAKMLAGTPAEIPGATPAETSGGAGIGGRAATVERRAVEVVGLLGGLIARLRTPLLAVTLLPAAPAAVLLVVAIVVGAGTPALVGLAGLVAPLWLTVRRRQLVTALVPADAAVADLKRTFDLAAIGGQLRDNLLRQDGRRLSLRPRALAGTVWRGISTTAALHGRVTDVPRLAPFLPGRLRGLAFLAIACVISAVVLVGYLALGLLLAGLTDGGAWSGL